MKTSTAFAVLAAAVASTLASPAYRAAAGVAAGALEARQAPICTSGTAQCCAVDVLGVADLDCANPPSLPTDNSNFIDICAQEGQKAMCCLLPVLQQGLICTEVVPSSS